MEGVVGEGGGRGEDGRGRRRRVRARPYFGEQTAVAANRLVRGAPRDEEATRATRTAFPSRGISTVEMPLPSDTMIDAIRTTAHRRDSSGGVPCKGVLGR
jgi:hypothetical protein